MLQTNLVLLLIAFGLCRSQTTSSDAKGTSQIVDVGYAQYQGAVNSHGNVEFLGLRYASPPVGTRVNGVQLANKHPPRCHVASWGTNPHSPFRSNASLESREGPRSRGSSPLVARDLQIPPISEDCLFLSVFIPGPKLTSSARLPVVVWIHGGGYNIGSATYPGAGPEVIYDGNDLVKFSGGNAIVIHLQYRLGLFGFLAGDDVKSKGALNAGLLDQQFALRWVQQHISKFGGDPLRVTVWGRSAGAGSVLQHLIANGGKTMPPLFKSAMLSSPFLPPQYWYNDRIPKALYNEVVTKTGCDSSQNKLECIRKADINLLDSANIAIGNNSFIGTFGFLPVVDGVLIQERPLQALQRRKLNTRNVLIMTNAHEGTIFVQQERIDDVVDYATQLFPTLSTPEAKSIANLYAGLGSGVEQAAQINGEVIFICPSYAIFRSLEGVGYKGQFAVPPAFHGNDIAYYFPSSSTTNAPPYNNTDFINSFSGAFLDFAVYRTPNGNRSESLLPTWPTWDERERKEIVFNQTDGSPVIRLESSSPAMLQRCK
ncbi:hypothetical protein D9611_011019 [Ephemerocybe angulata]|uniref:Carboxylic ester hydrolase n=1 Tax=Ephemerocybe angulata TaxID=980116 RepID=A0A8H5BD06_9AGAR|nr:hypothetical protein D9611_011019 [Tulosesus angulatus]